MSTVKPKKEKKKTAKGKGSKKGQAKPKSQFLGLTREDKAKSLGVTLAQYDARVAINKFRMAQARAHVSKYAKSSDPAVRQKAMKDAWPSANRAARAKFADLMKKNHINPETFKFK